eukprot:scaffold36390_cov144-Skeletonema_dohrnii-CCMP3373.AAC.2
MATSNNGVVSTPIKPKPMQSHDGRKQLRHERISFKRRSVRGEVDRATFPGSRHFIQATINNKKQAHAAPYSSVVLTYTSSQSQPGGLACLYYISMPAAWDDLEHT